MCVFFVKVETIIFEKNWVIKYFSYKLYDLDTNFMLINKKLLINPEVSVRRGMSKTTNAPIRNLKIVLNCYTISQGRCKLQFLNFDIKTAISVIYFAKCFFPRFKIKTSFSSTWQVRKFKIASTIT